MCRLLMETRRLWDIFRFLIPRRQFMEDLEKLGLDHCLFV